MELRRCSLVAFLVGTLLPISICHAQVLPSQSNRVSGTGQPSLLQKEIIERHFESIQPGPRPQFGGAIPGAHLLDQRSTRPAQLQNRVRASLAAQAEATVDNTTMPGIQLRPALAAGSVPTSVVTGDFNQDGLMDFIVANGLDNNLWIYLGKGDGTFQLPRIIPLSKGLSPVGLAVGDLRGSGKLDLVVAEFDTSTVGVLFGNGDGTFGFEQEYSLPEPPESLVVDDFNHDGKLDIAAAMDSTVSLGTSQIPYIALLTGDGTGNFGTPTNTSVTAFPSSAWNLASGDVNNDGLPDLLLTGPKYENSRIYINSGDGTFKPSQTLLQNTAASMLLDGRLADVNGDHCPDAVIADASALVWVAIGDCSGNFSTPNRVHMGDSAAAVRVVDVNGDGNPDIVASSLPAVNPALGFLAGNTFTVALGDGKGNFSVGRNYVGTGQAYSIGIADFNGDGRPDFVTANNDTDTVTVYQNDGSGGFGFPQGIFAGVSGQDPSTVNAPWSGLSFADLNNDGKMDAFFLDVGFTGEFYATAFLNDGTGRFSGPISSDTGAMGGPNNPIYDYKLGDFRNTGHPDMVSIGVDNSSYSPNILFLAGNGDGTFAKGTPVATTGADGLMTTGDFNHDGKLDFVAANGASPHTLRAFLGNGDGTFHALEPINFSDSAAAVYRVFTGDFNRDSKIDVLVHTSSNSYWTTNSTVWEFDGNGDGTFQTGRQLFTHFQPFTLADVNRDGYLDIARYNYQWPDGVTQTFGPPTFTTYLGRADGAFTQTSSYAPYMGIPESGPVAIQLGDPLASSLAADLNGDGKADEIAFQAAGYGGSEKYAQILMSNGDGTFTPTYDVFPFYYWGYPLYAHDLDGDGIADLVEVIGGTSSLQVYKGGRAPALQIALQDDVVKGNASCGWVFPNVASNSSTTVTLSSSFPGVILPPSVTVPVNAVSAQFCYTLDPNFDWRQVFDIKAQLNGDTATAYASDSYVLGYSLALSPVTPAIIYLDQNADPVTVTLTSSQGYNSTVKLSCEGMLQGDSCQFSADTLAVTPAAAATTVTFVTASSTAGIGNHTFTVVADDGNVIQRQSAAVTVTSLHLWNLPSQMQSGIPGTTSTQFLVTGIAPFVLSCSGLPAGAICYFSGNQATYPSNSGLAMTIAVPGGTSPGNYPVQVTVTSGSENFSASTTLQVLSFNVQGPAANNDWALAGGQQTIAITASTNVAESGSLAINCSMDIGGICFGGNISASQTTPQTVNLTLYPPSGASTGQHVLTVTAVYGSASQSFTFPFVIADFSGSLSASSATLTRSGTGSLTVTLNATAGFVDAVSLACNGTSQVTCSFSPSSVQLTGGTPQTVTATLSAGANASVPTPSQPFGRRWLVLATLFPFGVFFGLRRRRWRGLIALVAVLILLLPAMSCGSGGGSGVGSGGGSGSGGGGGGGSTGGGSNSYTVTVLASLPNTSVTKTLGTVNVTVNH